MRLRSGGPLRRRLRPPRHSPPPSFAAADHRVCRWREAALACSGADNSTRRRGEKLARLRARSSPSGPSHDQHAVRSYAKGFSFMGLLYTGSECCVETVRRAAASAYATRSPLSRSRRSELVTTCTIQPLRGARRGGFWRGRVSGDFCSSDTHYVCAIADSPSACSWLARHARRLRHVWRVQVSGTLGSSRFEWVATTATAC